MAIGLIQYYHLLANDITTIDTKTSVNTYLKNLMHYIHQNFLMVSKFILSRTMNHYKTNNWYSQLKKTVDEKMPVKIQNKAQACQIIKSNLDNSQNIFKNICKANSKKQFFYVLNEYLNKLYVFPNEKIRDVLYNIEQFKFDAHIPPELPMNASPSSMSNSTNSSSNSGTNSKTRTASNGKTSNNQTQTNNPMAKKMIKDSDKSSGTNNLIGNGKSTTLTGNNPFAVLKASAIAANQQAVFPNNFTNLPKVSPPFLHPLEGNDRHELYTLVLDLDETLIHNVEYGQESFFLMRPGCI